MNNRVVEVRLEGERRPAGIWNPAFLAADKVDAASAGGLGSRDENAAAGKDGGLDDRESFPVVASAILP